MDLDDFGIPLLLERNVVNQDEIDSFLTRLRASKPKVQKWIKSNLRNFIINDLKDVESVDSLPANAPAWMKAAQNRGDDLVSVSFTKEFKDKIEHTIHYLESDAAPQDPTRLPVPDAIKKSEQWMADLIKKKSDGPGKTKVIKTYDDGFKWVELLDQEALSDEGTKMGHCVGGYCEKVQSGDSIIWSLRDRKGDPHCTIEISGEEVVQIKGKGNAEVVEKYHKYVKDILSDKLKSYKVSDDILNIGMIQIDGVLFDLNNLPKDLKVGGGLYLSYTNITSLPEGLKVGGGLYLSYTNITSLPEGLKVDGYLDLSGTKITSLPEDLKVDGNLDLRNTNITSLPKGLKVDGDLYLNETPITSLPDGLEVRGYLDLRNTNITSLPDGLEVRGSLNLTGTQITSLPDGLEVGLSIYVDDPAKVTVPESLKGKLK